MKNWIITGKGFVNCGVDNPYKLGLEITDLKYKYNQIELYATENDLEKFVSELIKNESSFKMIDYFEKDSEDHLNYKYGPGEIFHPKNLRK